MNLAELRQHKMRTVNVSNPERSRAQLEWGLQPGETVTLMDVAGAGQLARLHITMYRGDPWMSRKVLLKIYWDGEETPSVLCPVGDFFRDGFAGQSIQFATPYFGNHGKHWYCYLPMPFARGCRIELVNQSDQVDRCVCYDVSYEEWDACPDDLGGASTRAGIARIPSCPANRVSCWIPKARPITQAPPTGIK